MGTRLTVRRNIEKSPPSTYRRATARHLPTLGADFSGHQSFKNI